MTGMHTFLLTRSLRLIARAFLLAAIANLSGCFYFSPDPSQTVRLDVRDATEQPVSAVCAVSNDRGTWTVIAPGQVQVPNSRIDLNVDCRRDGARPAIARVLARQASLAAFDVDRIKQPGGLKPYLDPVRYPAFLYPDRVTVQLGRVLVIDADGRSP
jgi:hypothetical protein